MIVKRIMFAVAVVLVTICLPTSGFALTAILSSDPANATINDRGIVCTSHDLTPVVSTVSIPGAEPFIPIFGAGVAGATGHGAITAALESSEGVKVAFINHPYDDESLSLVFIELLISSINPKQEGPFEERIGTVQSFFRYLISPGSFSTGALIFTIRGILSNADVLLFGSTSVSLPFKCSGAGMVEIRLPFSLRYE